MTVKRGKSGFTPLEMKVPNRGSKGFLTGFTIVELLTTLAIIAMLVGLLLPALSMVRNTARGAKQRAQFTTIELALTAFRNDDGDYPRSDWPPPGDYCGAQKLAEALLGRDLLGFHPRSNWDATDPTFYPTAPLLLEASLNQRRGPYLELATTNAFRLGNISANKPGLFNNTVPLAPDTFVLCDVFGAKRITLATGKTVKAGAPILYYRANTLSRTITTGLSQERIYDDRDNRPIIEIKRGEDQKDHPLRDTVRFYGNPADPTVIGYIQDPKITARDWPYRPDSYILISAGVDGLYGTRDDITNF